MPSPLVAPARDWWQIVQGCLCRISLADRARFMAVGGIGTYSMPYTANLHLLPISDLGGFHMRFFRSVEAGYSLLIGLVFVGLPTEQHDLSLEITIVDTLKSRKGFTVGCKSCSLI